MGDSTETETAEGAQTTEGGADVGLSELLEGDEAKSPDAPTRSDALAGFSWPNRLQELLIASAGATGATICASLLAGSGSDVETLEKLSVLFCGFAALSTWFLPLPKSSPRLLRIGSWAGLAVVLYWLGPIQIAETRAEHDLSHGTRSEKEAALERLVRLGKRDLGGADLRELNLSDADLTNLNLVRSNLSHSTLERALLLETDLSESDLAGASFRGANLTSAKLAGANLGKGADKARCDRFTQLPGDYECLHGSIAKKTTTSPKTAASR